jgi:hypothetical protein
VSIRRQCRRGAIVSLWEMLERHAAMFTEGFANLTEAKHLAALYGLNGGQPPEPGIRNLAKKASYRLRQALIYADMQEHIPSLDRLDSAIDGLGAMPLSNLSQAIMHTLSGIRDGLASEHFYHLDQRDVPLYMAVEPFGAKVGQKFPKAIEDVAEAAKCLALQRPTACVFHLMRAMELGVRALGKKLKVTINVEVETWYQIMEHVDGSIKRLPAQSEPEKKRKSKLAAASANLNAVRIAQRNEVMHPKQTYTREEAHDVFNATRLFMGHLAGLV